MSRSPLYEATMQPFSIRMTPPHIAVFLRLGGAGWLRKMLDEELNNAATPEEEALIEESREGGKT